MEKHTQPKWKDRRVRSWSGLLNALHRSALIPVQAGQGAHFRSPYVFRGMSDKSWPLQTSLERLGSPPEVERALLRAFRKYAPRGAFAEDSDWEVLSIAQHNGLPTRALDWSISPLVAAHFATAERAYTSKDGVIWCVDVIALRDRVLPRSISAPLRSAPAAVYDVRLLSNAYRWLEKFDGAVKGKACVFFEPPSIDARIVSQFGILSAMNGADRSHHEYFREQIASHPNLVHRIVIAASAKSEIRDMLDQNNINERMLFPGMPGLCDWLRRYYGPAYSRLADAAAHDPSASPETHRRGPDPDAVVPAGHP